MQLKVLLCMLAFCCWCDAVSSPDIVSWDTVVAVVCEHIQTETLPNTARANTCTQVCPKESEQDLLVFRGQFLSCLSPVPSPHPPTHPGPFPPSLFAFTHPSNIYPHGWGKKCLFHLSFGSVDITWWFEFLSPVLLN